MKKFDSLVANYLYTNKSVELEGIGKFSLDERFVLPPDVEKGAFFPLEGIHFSYDARAITSVGLIDFIIQHTGKIRSLVQADFSSYTSEVRQFVNIGKQWTIEGIGTLQKNKEGIFELVPGEAVAERVSMHYAEENDNEPQPVRRRKWMVGVVLMVAMLAVIGGIGFGVYVLFIKTADNSSMADPQPTSVFTPADTATQVQTDTAAVSTKPTAPNPADSFNYKVIHETTKWKQRVVARTTQLAQFGLRNHYDSLIIRDTLRYRMFIYQNIPLSDTNRVKDSLSLYFGRRVRLVNL